MPAEADHGQRLNAFQKIASTEIARAELPERSRQRDRVFARHCGGRDAVNGARGELDAVFLGADVGRKLDRVAAPRELLGKRRGGEQMAPGAAGGEEDRTEAHAAFSLTLCVSLSCSPGGLRFSCPAIGRLRVNPS